VRIEPGTHILLSMINSISTKEAVVGDRIYLETAFPVLSGSRIVIPQGSWVAGTVTHVKRPGRVKGRGQLQVRFDSLTLPNGISRNLRSDLSALDSRSGEKLNREKGTITSAGDKKGDTETVAGTATTGTIIGSGVGAAAGSIAKGAGIGGGAGAAAGLIGVLLSRGPDAVLRKGSTIEMVLDRPLLFEATDLNFSGAPPHAAPIEESIPTARSSRGWSPHLP
jgi:type IV secretion system protein VirB10